MELTSKDNEAQIELSIKTLTQQIVTSAQLQAKQRSQGNSLQGALFNTVNSLDDIQVG